MHLFGERLARERHDAGTISEGDTVTAEAAAFLTFDDQNPQDPNAVEVLILGRRVGYLPRGMAPHFRSYVKRSRLGGKSFRCMAEVELPLHSGEAIEVRLDLPQLKASP